MLRRAFFGALMGAPVAAKSVIEQAAAEPPVSELGKMVFSSTAHNGINKQSLLRDAVEREIDRKREKRTFMHQFGERHSAKKSWARHFMKSCEWDDHIAQRLPSLWDMSAKELLSLAKSEGVLSAVKDSYAKRLKTEYDDDFLF